MNVSRGKCSSRFPVKQKKTTRLGGDGKSPPKPQKGTPRRSGGLRPCPNDARFFLLRFSLAFSARVVLVFPSNRKRPPVWVVFFCLVGTVRLELMTSCMSSMRSNQLSYAPAFQLIYNIIFGRVLSNIFALF